MIDLKIVKTQVCLLLGVFTVLSFTGCKSVDASKPAKIDTISSEATIEDAAKVFEVTTDELQLYLKLNDMTWDEFVSNLNESSSTFQSLKDDVESNFAEDDVVKDATMADYIRYNLMEAPENNADVDNKYKEIKTLGNSYKIYLTDSDAKKFNIISDDKSIDNDIINVIAQYGTNPAYMLTAIESFYTEDNQDIEETHHSVEFIKSFVIKGDSGKILTDEMAENPFFTKDYIYTYDDDKKLKETAVANLIGVYTYDDNNKRIEKDDMYLLYVSNFGLLMESDNYENLMEISDVDIQIRYQLEKDMDTDESEDEHTEDVTELKSNE